VAHAIRPVAVRRAVSGLSGLADLGAAATLVKHNSTGRLICQVAFGLLTTQTRLVLQTTDGALIAMTYTVLRRGPAAVMQALDRGETVDPASHYYRLTGLFEPRASQYGWINRVMSSRLPVPQDDLTRRKTSA